jgi:hypothetical protein
MFEGWLIHRDGNLGGRAIMSSSKARGQRPVGSGVVIR